MTRRPVVLLALLAAAIVPSAAASPNLLVGVVDDSLKWSAEPKAASAMRDLGLRSIKVPLKWHPGQTKLSRTDMTAMGRVVRSTFGMRIVLAVDGKARQAPTQPAQAEQFCAYTRDALVRFRTINDVIIWTEPNSNDFWQPQFNRDGSSAAPAAYTALLARCWDVLHALRPGVNVLTNTSPRGNDNPLGVSNAGHSPGAFIRAMGVAYRASGRTRRIFDTVGHHPYPEISPESPFALHPRTGSIGQGDYDKLIAALLEAFGSTDQPLPGSDGVSIWYVEDGFQTTIPTSKMALYAGKENSHLVSHDFLHREQLLDAVRLAYCQPNVGGFFNFLLADEKNLAGWQSGVLWPDLTRKPAYTSFKAVIKEVAQRRVNCEALKRRQAEILAGGFVKPGPRPRP